jgi:glycosyltransferase involved in cell wall biosynthesis
MARHQRRLRILTWHVHGNYLYYLTRVTAHDWMLVHDDARGPHRSGKSGSLPWGDHVDEVHVDAVREREFDLVLYQSRDAWERDRLELLSPAQRALPRIYLEHDPPQAHPTNQVHWVDDPGALLVHVTPFNALMWDAGRTPATVVEHGVALLQPAGYSGELEAGVVVVNNLDRRGRRLGADVYAEAARQVPLTLVGMGAERSGGAGEVPNHALPAFMARHRYFFNPIRYTSLGLSIIEAMMVGLPVVGLATTELVTVIRSGENGFVDTRLPVLVDAMQRLRRDPAEARRLGEAARRTALERFGIERFVADWERVLQEVAG